MTSTEENARKERNKLVIKSFIEAIFNEHNLLYIEKYFGKESFEGGPHAGMGGQAFKQFLRLAI